MKIRRCAVGPVSLTVHDGQRQRRRVHLNRHRPGQRHDRRRHHHRHRARRAGCLRRRRGHLRLRGQHHRSRKPRPTAARPPVLTRARIPTATGPPGCTPRTAPSAPTRPGSARCAATATRLAPGPCWTAARRSASAWPPPASRTPVRPAPPTPTSAVPPATAPPAASATAAPTTPDASQRAYTVRAGPWPAWFAGQAQAPTGPGPRRPPGCRRCWRIPALEGAQTGKSRTSAGRAAAPAEPAVVARR